MVEIYNPSESGVTTINGLDGDVTLAAGTNITLVPVGQTITINSSGGASAFTDLTDVPASYTGQGGKVVAVKSDVSGLEFITQTSTDEKVKYDVGDPTAGYVADKFVAGTGITLSEGTGADENKLKITGTATYTLPIASASVLGGVKQGTNISIDANGVISATAGGTGDVVGPASATDGEVALFDTTTGKKIKGGGVLGSNAFNSTAFLTSLAGAVLTSQATPQTIGATGSRLAMLWATDITVTNKISGNITGNADGNAGTVTNGVYTTSDATALAATAVGDKGKYLKSNSSTGVLEWATVTTGAGDTISPATNTDGYIPLWNGANSKTLKDGIANASSNWNTAYGWGNHSGLYLPIGGGTLTGDLALTTHNITLTGSLGATGAGKLLKGWFTDVEITNLPTINGGTLATALGNYGGFLTSVTAHNLLSTTHGDTLADTVVRGDIIVGNSTPKWARLAFPATPTGKVLIATATDVAWSASALGTMAYEATGTYQTALGFTPEDVANKSTSMTTDAASTTKYPSVKLIKDYTDGLVAGLLDYRGAYDVTGTNAYPATGGSGTAGAVMKGDMWIISVAGTMGTAVVQIGDSIIANVDTPAQTDANWNVLNGNISYIPENAANKVTSISGASTDTQYPSAKLLYDQLAGKATGTIPVKATGAEINAETDDAKFATAKAIKDSYIGSPSLKITYTGTPQTELMLPITLGGMAIVPVATVAGQATYTAITGKTLDSFNYIEVAVPVGDALLTLSFDDLVNVLGAFSINGAAKITSISCPELINIGGSFQTSSLASLTTLSFPKLKYLYSASGISTIPLLTTLSFPELESVTSVWNPSGAAITTYSVPKLVYIGGTTVTGAMPALTTLSYPLLKYVGGNFGNSGTYTSLTTYEAPELIIIGGNFAPTSMTSLTSLSFPKLTTIGIGFTAGSMNNITSISFPALTYIGTGGLAPTSMSSLTTVAIDSLQTIVGATLFQGMSGLTTVSLAGMISYQSTISATSASTPNVSSITLGTIGTLKSILGATITLSGLKIPTANVDSILALLVSLDSTNGTTLWGSGKTLLINGGTNGAPTFSGSTATPAGSSFVGSTTTCTVSLNSHGYTTGDLLTISGITTLTNANGTFAIVVDNGNQFHYTIVSQSATGAGTAAVKKAGSTTEGYYYKQVLQVRGATITTN